jgi:hypothetical protein
MNRRFSLLGNVGALALIAGCASSAKDSRSGARQLENRSTSDASAPKDALPTPTGLDDLPVPKDGFQVMDVGADIGPGEDVEYCEIGELPGDPSETYYVGGVELANAPHSHHMVVATAQPGSDADAALRAMNIGDKVTCNGTNYEFPQDGLVFVASAQTPYIDRTFPRGVGTVLHGNQRVVFDYHYLNTSTEVVHARSAINVHLVDADTVEHIANAFSFFNYTVDVPPHGTGKFVAECHFKDDLMVTSILRHTHQQGRDFSVWYAGGAHDGEQIWTSHDWKNEPDYAFPTPTLIKANEGFRFECDFQNDADSDLRYGIKGTDEMCILAGWFWPAGTRELPPAQCGVVWIDSKGIGHPADEAGGFPKATALNARVCLAGISLSGYGGDDTCNACMCNSCGDVLVKCAADSDCSALMDCFSQGCTGDADCAQKCKQPLHDHSSAIGMVEEVEACLSSKCSGCGPL